MCALAFSRYTGTRAVDSRWMRARRGCRIELMPHQRKSGRVLVVLAAVLAAAAAALYHQLGASMEQRSAAPTGTRVQVHAGASLRSVLAELARAHAVHDPRLVEWSLRLHGEQLRAQAGTYELEPGATVRQTLDQIAGGRVVMSQ